jgi:hypothetical protein
VSLGGVGWRVAVVVGSRGRRARRRVAGRAVRDSCSCLRQGDWVVGAALGSVGGGGGSRAARRRRQGQSGMGGKGRLPLAISEPLGECGRETQAGLAGVTRGPST